MIFRLVCHALLVDRPKHAILFLQVLRNFTKASYLLIFIITIASRLSSARTNEYITLPLRIVPHLSPSQVRLLVTVMLHHPSQVIGTIYSAVNN